MARKDNIFTKVMMKAPPSNTFDLSHDVKMSFNMGHLVPSCVMEVIPGDKFKINVQNMLRFAPLVAPVMHRVKVTTHFFFVPNRILWNGWEDFITNQEAGGLFPTMVLAEGNCTPQAGSLADYMGVPTGDYTNAHLQCSPFPFAAYAKIYDDWYRDQNLQDEVFHPLISGPNNTYYEGFAMNKPLRRAWQHDYFTSCLPFAQKGDEVQLPLTTGTVPVELTPNGQPMKVAQADGTPMGGPAALSSASGSSSLVASSTGAVIDPNGTLTVDPQTNATTINTLRRAFRLQEFLERNARGGTRYIENILSHFGIKSSDSRLQRSEYLGGAKQNMVISEVLATAQNSEAEIAVGNLAGHGISVGSGDTFEYFAEEHGYIIGLINVQPDTAYQDGLHRHFTRFTPLDFPWPTFANIGEQEVKLKEVMANLPAGADPDSTFGYNARYSELKFMNSRVAGDMRTSLRYWHLGRIFEGDTLSDVPALNEQFIQCAPDNRIFAFVDDTADHIYSHILNNVTVRRKLPRYGVPTI